MSKPMSSDGDLRTTLAHHDAAIQNLGGRMTGVESSVRTLQGEVHAGFVSLGSKMDKMDAQPRFDFHQTVSTVTTIAVLFSMIVGGIIWITTSQFSTVVERVRQHEQELKAISEKTGWHPRVVESRK